MPHSSEPTHPNDMRTLVKYSLLLATSLSRLANNVACSWACARTLSTSAFLNVTGGSKKETVPSVDSRADISEDAIYAAMTHTYARV